MCLVRFIYKIPLSSFSASGFPRLSTFSTSDREALYRLAIQRRANDCSNATVQQQQQYPGSSQSETAASRPTSNPNNCRCPHPSNDSLSLLPPLYPSLSLAGALR
ncbi:hypothetical protein AMECASPLE_015519 [Ameca splendens]|uniref:Uncharacterized protein n=1 Tax=Ameca splendens TaxID=208324 RepID=A0ABV0YCZ3_9TELE